MGQPPGVLIARPLDAGGRFAGSLEQPGRLAFDDRQVPVFVQFQFPGMHEFKQFAFRDRIGGIGQDSGDLGLVDFDNHAESP